MAETGEFHWLSPSGWDQKIFGTFTTADHGFTTTDAIWAWVAGLTWLETEFVGVDMTGEIDDDSDPANLATDLYLNELDESFADDLRRQLEAVERAEARLAAGTYGLSVESGEPIPDARLEILPTAELTTDEERARER